MIDTVMLTLYFVPLLFCYITGVLAYQGLKDFPLGRTKALTIWFIVTSIPVVNLAVMIYGIFKLFKFYKQEKNGSKN